jgi:hypothetical protein
MASYSSQCQPIADKVKDLDADITSAQKSLQSALCRYGMNAIISYAVISLSI